VEATKLLKPLVQRVAIRSLTATDRSFLMRLSTYTSILKLKASTGGSFMAVERSSRSFRGISEKPRFYL
jgi:hypothetical protein